MASKRSDREDDIIAKKAVKAIFSESFNGKKKFKDDINDSDRLRVRIKGKPGAEDQVAIAKDGTTLPDFLNEISSSSMVDISELNSFRSMSSDREVQYRIYDEMALDTIISSALELYADDSTQYNSKGEIIWVESENTDVAAFGNRLINKLNLNENAWSHIYSLVKYGDLYLETFRDDETDDNPILTTDLPYSDIKVHKERKGTQMEEYIEAVPNPAEIFDLTKRGKTVGFIKTPTDDSDALTPHYGYQMMTEGDETVVLRPDKYVHVSLSSDVNRFPETIKLRYMNDSKDEDVNYNSVDDMNVHTYTVSRGKSILHDVYKSYKELSLMEDSLLLNRVTRSSIIRLLQIEVGDMEKGQVREVLKRYKNLMEQKNYVDKIDGTYTSMASPGPIDNILYIPTKDGKGNVTASNIGGDVDVKSIVDIDYFKNKVYGGLKIPNAFLEGHSDDGGLSAGTALTKLDSRYARTIKRIQNAYIQGITTLINIYALDRGISDHVNNFSVKMLSPSTVEDSERDETMDSRMNMISNFMGLVDDESLFSNETRKDVLTYLVSTLLSEPDISEILENDDTAKKSDEDNLADSEEKEDSDFSDTDFGSDDFGDFSDEDFGDEDLELGEEGENVDLNGEDISPTEDEEFGDFSDEF